MSDSLVQILASALVGAVGSGGAAWAGVKVTLNGTRERVKEVQAEVKEMNGKLDNLRDDHRDLRERVVVIEAVDRRSGLDRRSGDDRRGAA